MKDRLSKKHIIWLALLGFSAAADDSFVLACRNDEGWQVEAVSQFSADSAGMQFATPVSHEVGEAMEALNPKRELLDEQEIIEAAAKGWRRP